MSSATTSTTSDAASCWCHACNATRKVQTVNEEVQCSDCHSSFVELSSPRSQTPSPATSLPQTYDTLLGGDGGRASPADPNLAQASPTNIQIPPLTRQPSSETQFIPFSITVQSYSYSPMGNVQLHRTTSQPEQQGADAYAMLQQLLGGMWGNAGSVEPQQQQQQTAAETAAPADAAQQQSQPTQQPHQQQQQQHQQRPQFFPGLHPFLQMLAMSPMPMMFAMPGHMHMHHHHHATPPTASKAAVEALEKLTICKQQVEEESQCSVCLTEFEENDDALRMPCGGGKHIYHPQCLLEWLKKSNRCPTCRHELPTDDAHYNAMLEHQRQQQQQAASTNPDAQSAH